MRAYTIICLLLICNTVGAQFKDFHKAIDSLEHFDGFKYPADIRILMEEVAKHPQPFVLHFYCGAWLNMKLMDMKNFYPGSNLDDRRTFKEQYDDPGFVVKFTYPYLPFARRCGGDGLVFLCVKNKTDSIFKVNFDGSYGMHYQAAAITIFTGEITSVVKEIRRCKDTLLVIKAQQNIKNLLPAERYFEPDMESGGDYETLLKKLMKGVGDTIQMPHWNVGDPTMLEELNVRVATVDAVHRFVYLQDNVNECIVAYLDDEEYKCFNDLGLVRKYLQL